MSVGQSDRPKKQFVPLLSDLRDMRASDNLFQDSLLRIELDELVAAIHRPVDHALKELLLEAKTVLESAPAGSVTAKVSVSASKRDEVSAHSGCHRTARLSFPSIGLLTSGRRRWIFCRPRRSQSSGRCCMIV